MTLPYSREDEFRDRYLHTVIYFKGEPVYIVDIAPSRGARDAGEVKLVYTRLPQNYDTENKQYRELATHEGFTDSPNLGYANAFAKPDYDDEYKDVVKYGAYLSRMPIRRSKQGLFSESLYIPKGCNKGFIDLLYTPEFVDMLTGKYQSFKEIRDLVTTNRGKFGVMGFDPVLALKMNKLEQLVLFYKEDQVGYSLDGGDNFNLVKGKRWLAEQLEEKGLKVA